MPRYLIERTFCEGFTLPVSRQEPQAHQDFIANNAMENVTWIYSFIDPSHRKSFCIYDAPSPAALRQAAQHNGLPIDRITEVCLLDPFCFIPKPG